MSDLEPLSLNLQLVFALQVASVDFFHASVGLTLLLARHYLGVILIVLYAAVLWGLRTKVPKVFALVLAAGLGAWWSVFSATLTC
ncbi:MAG: hypothetical protein ACM3NO_01715 [Deltaproteobacteria bacterium]